MSTVQTQPAPNDVHSYSNPHQVILQHLELDLAVDFVRRELIGSALLTVKRNDPYAPLVLDTQNLTITDVSFIEGDSRSAAAFDVGTLDPILGSELRITLPRHDGRVRIDYHTSPNASALQWLEPIQTAGRRHPYMFSQSQPIHARSWLPIQDSPRIRFTYSARIRTPPELLAVMSAANNPSELADGNYFFEMLQPIPSYLLAIAVGNLAFQSLGQRTGVYSEPEILKKAAEEFSDTEKMIIATERLYGVYQWDRYDLLVLPPSFPLGGMENPKLTFVTPTILAGDKSLISLIAHELAHSWSGNLVTNATWSDFWLNEGFTTYVERRVMEELYGREREEMEAALGRRILEDEMATLDDNAQKLHLDLSGRDPDDGTTKVPYEKGALFLRQLEEVFGRTVFDEFLKTYFERFAFKSMTTEAFVSYLKRELFSVNPERASHIPLEQWLYEPGIPDVAPMPKSDAFMRVEEAANEWLRRKVGSELFRSKDWTTHEWLHFLKHLAKNLDSERMQELDRVLNLTDNGNSEIAHQWLLLAIRNQYHAAYPRLTEYLQSIGREKLVKPLYEELIKSDAGRETAIAIYRIARARYHPIVVKKIDGLLNS